MYKLLSLFYGMSILVHDLESEILSILEKNGGEITLQQLYYMFASKTSSSYPIYRAIKSLENQGKVSVKITHTQMKIALTGTE